MATTKDLIVFNLPFKMTDKEFKEYFEFYGEVKKAETKLTGNTVGNYKNQVKKDLGLQTTEQVLSAEFYFLQNRKLEYKKLAIIANKNANKELAIEFLKMAKGCGNNMERMQENLPLDISQLLPPPEGFFGAFEEAQRNTAQLYEAKIVLLEKEKEQLEVELKLKRSKEHHVEVDVVPFDQKVTNTKKTFPLKTVSADEIRMEDFVRGRPLAFISTTDESLEDSLKEAPICEEAQAVKIKLEPPPLPKLLPPPVHQASVGIKRSITDVDNVYATGLPNCGNSCFMNSILQVLRYTPEFMRVLQFLIKAQNQLYEVSKWEEESKEVMYLKNIDLLFSEMKTEENLRRENGEKNNGESLLKYVQLVINSLRDISSLFQVGEENDAHEFLISTFVAFSSAYDTIKYRMVSIQSDDEQSDPLFEVEHTTLPSTIEESEYLGLKRRRIHTKLFALEKFPAVLNLGFECVIKHFIQCLSCKKRIEREEQIFNVDVHFPEMTTDQGTVKLLDCFPKSTILYGDNRYHCAICQCLKDAKSYSEVTSLPSVLMLHFSCLTTTWDVNNINKPNPKVVIPLLFKTSTIDMFSEMPGADYKLFAIAFHIGKTTLKGHYVSFIKDQFVSPETTDVTKWRLFNDINVSCFDIDKSKNYFPYVNCLGINATPSIIFYKKS